MRWKNPDNNADGRAENKFSATNRLTTSERQAVLDVACSAEFRDKSPTQIVPILAEKGQYLASESTFFRILHADGLMTHRSKSKAPERKRPDAIEATAPNQVWSWDISYLLTNARGVYFYLYVILDIWDRSIVGWSIEEQESGALAASLLEKTCKAQGIARGSLTVHQDNGAPMVSSEFLTMLTRYGKASYSRPGVSDDNAFSESHFRTLKYRPNYPDLFDSIDDARSWMTNFATWYNTEHRHSGIGFVTPSERRRGLDIEILARRRATYARAKASNPTRWSGKIRAWSRPEKVTLNARREKNTVQERAA